MIEYLLFEQKYMELVASGSTIEAITVLQTELHRRAPIQERLHELAQLILLAQSSSSCIASSPVEASDAEKAQEDSIVDINVVEKKEVDSKFINGYMTVGEIKVEQNNILERCEDSELQQALDTRKNEKLSQNGTKTHCRLQQNEKELLQQ